MGRSEHRYANGRLHAYVDDELHPDGVDRVTSHIVECPDCSADVRFMLRIRAALLQTSGVQRGGIV
jgi:anti-sigma factor RsiW